MSGTRPLSRWSLAVVLPATLCALWAFAGSDSTLPAGVDDVDVLLLYTQNTQGFLRSCGCSGSESVGLAQAVEVIRKLREQFPGKVLAVDAGNLADDEKRGRVVWQALCEAKYDAVSFGPADAKWAEAYWRLASERPLTVVGLPLDNAEPDGRSLSYLRQPFAVVQVGERRIGLLSTGPETALSAEQAKLLVDVASTLRTGCDLMVLLTYRSLAEERHFSRATSAGRWTWWSARGARTGSRSRFASGTATCCRPPCKEGKWAWLRCGGGPPRPTAASATLPWSLSRCR